MNLLIYVSAIPEDAEPELRKLCVSECLDRYVCVTESLRVASPSSQLLVCYGSAKRGRPVSKQRVSTWLKEAVTECYRLQGVALPGSVRGHDSWRQATSWAHVGGLAPRLICEAALWQSSNMFARHYKLDLLHADHRELGRRVLTLATPAAT